MILLLYRKLLLRPRSQWKRHVMLLHREATGIKTQILLRDLGRGLLIQAAKVMIQLGQRFLEKKAVQGSAGWVQVSLTWKISS
jgi:hypothetical protein